MSNPTVLLETTSGDILIELFPDKAPDTVATFLQYVDDGFYANTIFHRVIPGFMIQGGGLGPRMDEKATRAPIKNEADNGLSNDRGTIAMARTMDPHSATAQFFINLVDNEELDFFVVTYTYPEMDFEEVGFFAVKDTFRLKQGFRIRAISTYNVGVDNDGVGARIVEQNDFYPFGRSHISVVAQTYQKIGSFDIMEVIGHAVLFQPVGNGDVFRIGKIYLEQRIDL